MALIKDIYSKAFYTKLADSLQKVLPTVTRKDLLSRVLTESFAHMEWKERMQFTTQVLHHYMPAAYPKSVALLEKIIAQLKADGFREDMLEFMFLPDYVATYGLDDFDHSVKALEFITQYVSCEFAVRPFLLKYGNRMMEQMLKWSLHPSPKVRRFASEGSRPRLPWAMAIPALKKDPSPVLPVLENLKNDPAEWVRRSVANNLNDIAKDHPDVVLAVVARWQGVSKETDAILKHGSRTLLKKGHPEILAHYGLNAKEINLSGFKVLTPLVRTGGHLEFACYVTNKAAAPQTVRLEYAIYYMKSNGQPSKKVFKISERPYQPGEKISVNRKHSFKPITTRRLYPGKHQVAIIINGVEQRSAAFDLGA